MYSYVCPQCDTTFEYRKKNRRFCSSKCSATYHGPPGSRKADEVPNRFPPEMTLLERMLAVDSTR